MTFTEKVNLLIRHLCDKFRRNSYELEDIDYVDGNGNRISVKPDGTYAATTADAPDTVTTGVYRTHPGGVIDVNMFDRRPISTIAGHNKYRIDYDMTGYDTARKVYPKLSKMTPQLERDIAEAQNTVRDLRAKAAQLMNKQEVQKLVDDKADSKDTQG